MELKAVLPVAILNHVAQESADVIWGMFCGHGNPGEKGEARRSKDILPLPLCQEVIIDGFVILIR
jgi:hypothetical protein